MSHAGMIIGIPGLQIERVKRSQGIEVWARLARKQSQIEDVAGTHSVVITRVRLNAHPPAQSVTDHGQFHFHMSDCRPRNVFVLSAFFTCVASKIY